MFGPESSSLLRRLLQDKSIQKQIDQDFSLRLSANIETIYQLASKLYGAHHKVDEVVTGIVSELASAYDARSQELRNLDLRRMEDSMWFCSEKWVGMMFYVDRFAGNLTGLQSKLSYFEELGVNFLHLMPLLKSPPIYNDGGYAISDFMEVEPRLGTMKQLEDLAGQLRSKDMLMMLDITINHTSNEHIWAKRAKNGDKEYQDYYYMYGDRFTPDAFEQSLPEVFPDTAPGNFTFQPEIDQWVMTVFHNYQWDLNFNNPAVFNRMLGSIAFLINKGVDIMRLDALAFTWKQAGTTSQNLDEAHQLIRLFKACAQVFAPGTLFLAEAIVAPQEIIKYFGDLETGSNECELAYNATLMTLLWEAIATKNNKLLSISLANIPHKPYGTSWLNYVRCHDDIGLGYEDQHARWAGYDAWSHRRFITDFLIGNIDWSFATGAPFMIEKETGNARVSGSLASLVGLEKAINNNNQDEIDVAIRRIVMLHAVILSYGGIPMLYMGDEVATTNDYSYLESEQTKHDNRWMHRPRFDAERDKLRKKSGSVEQRVFSQISHLISLRKQTVEFADHNNCYRIESRNSSVFAFIRAAGVYRTLCIYNLNDHPESFYLDVLQEHGFAPKHQLFDRITDQYLDNAEYNILLQPYQSCWLSLKP
ncbi:MAG: amylosucrase [Cyclobacteriaceae bacterium]|jgi:amylosucrase